MASTRSSASPSRRFHSFAISFNEPLGIERARSTRGADKAFLAVQFVININRMLIETADHNIRRVAVFVQDRATNECSYSGFEAASQPCDGFLANYAVSLPRWSSTERTMLAVPFPSGIKRSRPFL